MILISFNVHFIIIIKYSRRQSLADELRTVILDVFISYSMEKVSISFMVACGLIILKGFNQNTYNTKELWLDMIHKSAEPAKSNKNLWKTSCEIRVVVGFGVTRFFFFKGNSSHPVPPISESTSWIFWHELHALIEINGWLLWFNFLLINIMYWYLVQPHE